MHWTILIDTKLKITDFKNIYMKDFVRFFLLFRNDLFFSRFLCFFIRFFKYACKCGYNSSLPIAVPMHIVTRMTGVFVLEMPKQFV